MFARHASRPSTMPKSVCRQVACAKARGFFSSPGTPGSPRAGWKRSMKYERIERDMLRERHPDRDPLRRKRKPPSHFVESDAEHRAVQRVCTEPCGGPGRAASDRLPEHRDIRVVAAKGTFVQRLLERPQRRSRSAGEGQISPVRPCAQAAPWRSSRNLQAGGSSCDEESPARAGKSPAVTRLFAGTQGQGRQDSNLQPPVLETGALPVELRP